LRTRAHYPAIDKAPSFGALSIAALAAAHSVGVSRNATSAIASPISPNAIAPGLLA
jgi:hypothetical protein